MLWAMKFHEFVIGCRKCTAVVGVLILCAVSAVGNQMKVTRNVNLRPDASIRGTSIRILRPGEKVDQVESAPSNGYYHVRTSKGEDGWVWGRNVKTLPESGHVNAGFGDEAVFASLETGKISAIGQPLVVRRNGQETEVCGPDGETPDQRKKELNRNKNRADTPDQYVDISWNMLKDLPANRVVDFQGAPVAVIGYLSHQIKIENGGESTNCGLHENDEVDWHMYLTKSPGREIKDAIIVETTPRVRPLHTWDKDNLDQYVNSDTEVRISGWLMYDWEHENVIGIQRTTVWEVHPITRIEILSDGQWVDTEAHP